MKREIIQGFLDVSLVVVNKQVDELENKLLDAFYTHTLHLDDSLAFGLPDTKYDKSTIGRSLNERKEESVTQLDLQPTHWETDMAKEKDRNDLVNHNARQYFCAIRQILAVLLNAYQHRYVDDFMMGNQGIPGNVEVKGRFATEMSEALYEKEKVLMHRISSETTPKIEKLDAQLAFLRSVIGDSERLKKFYDDDVRKSH